MKAQERGSFPRQQLGEATGFTVTELISYRSKNKVIPGKD